MPQLKKIIKLWLHDWIPEGADRSEVLRKCHSGCVNRAIVLCLLFSFGFATYGIVSLEFIQKFDPQVSLASNLMPRLCLNSLPFLLLALFLRKARHSPTSKLIVFVLATSSILQAASWIHVWPIALGGHPEILFGVHAVNHFVYSSIFFMVMPTTRMMFLFLTTFEAVFWGPFFALLLLAGWNDAANLMLYDHINALTFTMFSGSLLARVRVQIVTKDLVRKDNVESFLGPQLAKAIYHLGVGDFEPRSSIGFLITIDLRQFTSTTRGMPPLLLSSFVNSYYESAARLIRQYGGVLHKSLGDGLLLSFGIMDSFPELPLDGFDREQQLAAWRRNADLFRGAAICIAKIATLAAELGTSTFGRPMEIGAGIDYGELAILVLGSRETGRQQDIAGELINRCTRLEAFTKQVVKAHPNMRNVVVVSPYASAMLSSVEGFQKFDLEGERIRDFPEIRELFVAGAAEILNALEFKGEKYSACSRLTA